MITTNNIIDCRNKECSLENSNISEKLKSLGNGDSIHLKATTDPMKLYYKILPKTNGNFHWIPLKEVPGEWEVLIEKSFTI